MKCSKPTYKPADHRKAAARVQRRREEAKARQEEADARSPEEQLARLDAGNHRAKKERKKLNAIIG